MRTWDITALGELLIDFAPGDKPWTFEAKPGGAPANLLAAAQQFGSRTNFIGQVGRDAFGDFLIRTLEDHGINCTSVTQTDEAFTTLAFVVLAKDGDRDFSFSRKPGADTLLTLDAQAKALIKDSSIFHFGTLSLTTELAKAATHESVTWAKEQDVFISFDPNYRAPLWPDEASAREAMRWGAAHANLIKLGKDELLFMYKSRDEAYAIRRLFAEPSLHVALVTDGDRGSEYYIRQGMSKSNLQSGFIPAYVLGKAVDTTGAGDIFTGVALALFLQDFQETAEAESSLLVPRLVKHLTPTLLERYLPLASAAAALSTRKHGGISSIPDVSEVEVFLGEQ